MVNLMLIVKLSSLSLLLKGSLKFIYMMVRDRERRAGIRASPWYSSYTELMFTALIAVTKVYDSELRDYNDAIRS